MDRFEVFRLKDSNDFYRWAIRLSLLGAMSCHLPQFRSFDDHPIFQQLELGHGKVFCLNFL